MSAIRLQYSTEPGLSSWAIRRWTNSDWSHVDAVLPDGRLLGARPDYPVSGQTGVQIRPTEYAPFSGRLVVEIATDKSPAFYAALRNQLGKPYNTQGILNFIFDQDARFNPADGWFCDQLQLAMAQQAGIFPGKLAVPFRRVAPGASLLAFSALPGFSGIAA